MFVYVVTQKNGRTHNVLLDEDIGKTICVSNTKKAFYFYVQHQDKLVGLARYIMRDQLADDDCVDHKDWDPSNNLKENLRVVTREQNNWNVKRRSHNTTGLIGVHKYPPRRTNLKPYFAKIKQWGRQHHLGSFDTAEEASIAYDMACHNCRGEFAVLNNPANVFKNAVHIR